MGGGDFMVYEYKMACYRRKWASDIVLRDNDTVCNDFSCAVGYWWGGEKIVYLVWRLRNLCKFCVAGATEISYRELHVTHVDSCSIVP
jgi:hypothetical protein